MPWVLRGLRDGRLTTSWPGKPDSVFDGFPAAMTVTDPVAEIDGVDAVARAARECPTGAISLDRGRPSLDRGRCILCGRCAAIAPATFVAEAGSATARLARPALVVPSTADSEDAVAAVRADLAVRVRRLRRSVHIRHVDCGSDGAEEWEIQALTNPVYDIHRLGIFFTASPRHADIALLTGIGAAEMIPPLHRTLAAMPAPTVIIAAGTDAISGGLIGRGYGTAHGIGEHADVDVLIPGSPPSPFSLLHGILLALGRLQPNYGGTVR